MMDELNAFVIFMLSKLFGLGEKDSAIFTV